MAYSNWGGQVWKNGEDVSKQKCDVPVFGDSEAEEAAPHGLRIFINLLKNEEKNGGSVEGERTPWWQHAHHAVLGDGKIRLAGYKSSAELMRFNDDGTVDKLEFPYPKSSWTDKEGKEHFWSTPEHEVEYKVEVDGYAATATHGESPEMVTLTLTEPDGTKWNGFSGIYMGAGYEF